MRPQTEDPTCRSAASDRELVARMRAGRRDAFGELYDRYCDRAYHVARAVSIDDAQAQDAVEEAFVSIWKSRAADRPRQPTAAAWVLSVVREHAIDLGRRPAPPDARRGNEDQVVRHGAGEDRAPAAVDRRQARDLKALLGELPDAQREVIVLAVYGRLTHVEIAQELALPIETVKGRMRSGLRKLHGELDNVAA